VQTALVSAEFQRLRNDPLRLRAFLAAMPKGGDLHNHLDGAIYAESFLARAASGGLCIDTNALAIRRPPCNAHQPRADQALAEQPGLENAMIDALSMRDFFPRTGDMSGHDHFFATFEKFHAAADDVGATLVEEARRAAAEHIDYLEILWLPQVRESIKLGDSAAWRGEDFAADLAPIAGAIDGLVAQARRIVDTAEAHMRSTLRCATRTPEPGCLVTIRYQAFSLRTFSPQAVFAQMAYDFAVVQADPRFVGVNIVAPEDDPVALRDYTLHMRMLHFFHQAHPQIKLSLHAGELAFGLVPPEALRFHIRQAVEIAGASRIGHGVSVMYEDDPAGLLAELAHRKVAVEINQTSNAQILGVQGAHHPFANYRAAGVPVVISTDDQGVERTDLTQEFVRAAETWHLDYRDLKALSRASILYSFLPGAPLAVAADGEPRKPDGVLLAASEKARLQQRLEQEFKAFEYAMARRPWAAKARKEGLLF
jgi:adenosine deaminase